MFLLYSNLGDCPMTVDEIINFWFHEIEPKSWWVKDAEFDQMLRDRFSNIHQQAARGELYQWRLSALGRLAEIIILDQFSRNMFRGQAQSFAYDALALILAQEARALNCQDDLEDKHKAFLYMPYMHSESLIIHQQALIIFSEPGLEGNTEFEKRHLAIIEQFGRYPHRNEILNRQSTDAELKFLQQPGSSF